MSVSVSVSEEEEKEEEEEEKKEEVGRGLPNNKNPNHKDMGKKETFVPYGSQESSWVAPRCPQDCPNEFQNGPQVCAIW